MSVILASLFPGFGYNENMKKLRVYILQTYVRSEVVAGPGRGRARGAVGGSCPVISGALGLKRADFLYAVQVQRERRYSIEAHSFRFGNKDRVLDNACSGFWE